MAAAATLGLDRAAVPAHVALIMDGNGRWASEQGKPRLAGHAEGYRTLKDVLLAAEAIGVRVLTVYAFSAENWRRPDDEVTGLMALIAAAARTELSGLLESNVRTRLAGRIDELVPETREALRALESETAANTGITFVLAVNYGGRAEIADAARRVVQEGLSADAVDEEALAARLYNPDLPEVDLMVRTAGEMRWSNFLIWQAAYAELVVTDKPWPEFGPEELVAAVAEYAVRHRKFGGL
jgi:undecaprenyl diphosphate synthase